MVANVKEGKEGASSALVHVSGAPVDPSRVDVPGVTGPSIEELRKIQERKNRLAKYKVVEKKKPEADAGKSLKQQLLKEQMKRIQ